MKRRLIIANLIIAFAFVLLHAPVLAEHTQKEIPVFIDGLAVKFDVPPVNHQGRVLIPFRAIAEALNVDVGWDESTRTVTAKDSDTSITLQIGNNTAFKNEGAISLDVPPMIINGRTLIPIRFFSEAFGCNVVWDKDIGGVRIISSKKVMEVVGFYALGTKETSSWYNLFGKAYPETDKGNTDIVSELSLGWYGMDGEGNLVTNSKTGWQKPDGWEKILEAAKTYNLKTEMCIHMLDGDYSVTKLLADTGAVSKAVDNIASEAYMYSGVNIDFEGLGLSEKGEELQKVKASFNYFVYVLSKRLKKEGLSLTLTLHAPNSAYKGYDYNVLGQFADKIIIMAHDYGIKPEPENLVIEAVEEAVEMIPREKLFLAVLAPNENKDSIILKVGIAKRYRLKGISLWRLGVITDEMWNSLRESIEARQD